MMNLKKLKKPLASAVAMSMVAGMVPVNVLAVEGNVVAADGTYTKTAHVTRTQEDIDEENEWTEYDVDVTLKVEDGKFATITVNPKNGYDESENGNYFSKAYNKSKGIQKKLEGQDATEDVINTWDSVSGATRTCNAIKEAALEAIHSASEKKDESGTPGDTEGGTSSGTENGTLTGSGYVLMNIPYAQFYDAEGVSSVDAVTTATVKTYNQSKAAGSYHANYTDEDPKSGDEAILGTTYPVYVEDLSLLKDMTRVTDETTATITVATGKSSFENKEVTGTDVLFASGDYAYYVLTGTPSNYKTLTVGADGSFTFSKANTEAVTGTANVEVKYACHYTDIEFVVDAPEVTNASAVNAIVLTTSEGAKYALRHVENEWNRTDLGWNWDDLDGNGLGGKTITNVTYYLKNADSTYTTHSYATNVTMKQNPGAATASFTDTNTINLEGIPTDIQNAKATVKTVVGRGQTASVIAENVTVENNKITTTKLAGKRAYAITITSDNYGDISINADCTFAEEGYVLMNIPYAEFYTAEGVASVDTVTSATVKTYNQSKAAGSYHANYIDEEPQSGDEEILGVTYPVYVEDMSALNDITKVTDETTATITVAKGKSATELKEVTGKDVLFASGDHAYYVLTGTPSNYKTLTVGTDGSFTFGVANGTVENKTAEIEVKYACHYTDIEFVIDAEEITNAAAMNAIVLTTEDGSTYALRHVENEWGRTDLGWNWKDLDGNGLSGKTIKNVKYYLLNAEGEYKIYSYDIDVTMKQNPGEETTATFTDSKTITLTGLPSDIENAKATVKTVVGRGETATVIAENVNVANNTIVTAEEAEAKEYAITIVSDNYGDIVVNATYVAQEPTNPEEPENPDAPDNGTTNPDTPTTPDAPANPDTPKDDGTTKPGTSTDNGTTKPGVSTDNGTTKPGTSIDNGTTKPGASTNNGTTNTSNKVTQADTSKTPKTGDTSNVFVWAGTMFAAMAGAAITMFKGKTNKNK